MQQLQHYIDPLKKSLLALHAEQESLITQSQSVPFNPYTKTEDIEPLSQELLSILPTLNFSAKKYIINLLIIKVVASQQQIAITGHFPKNLNEYIEMCFNNRYGQNTIRHLKDSDEWMTPFEFRIDTSSFYNLRRIS